MTKYTKQAPLTHGRHSDYKGVRWSKMYGKFHATFKLDGVTYECGYHDCDRMAARSRDMKMISLGVMKGLQILTKK